MRKSMRFITFIIALVMALSLTGITKVSAAGTGGEIAIVVMTDAETVIAPEYITYSEGDTLKQALLSSKHSFTGLQQGFITGIDGTADNFSFFFDGGGASFDKSASSISAVCFSTKGIYSDNMIELIKLMAEFNTSLSGVKSFKPAKNAYDNALMKMRVADATVAASLKKDLEDAINNYNNIVNGEKYKISIDALQNGQSISNLAIVLTDEFDINFSANGTSVNVPAGNYKYKISTDKGHNGVEGTIKVTGAQTLTVKLPYGSWIDGNSVKLLRKSGSTDVYGKKATDDSSAEFLVPDTAKNGQIYIYADQGKDIPDKTTRLYAVYTGTDGNDKSQMARSWSSTTSSLSYLLKSGMEGKSFDIAAKLDKNGCTMFQTYTINISRIPTLSSLKIMSNGTSIPLGFDMNKFEYDIKVTGNSIDLNAVPFGDYSISVGQTDADKNGNINLSSVGKSVNLDVKNKNGEVGTYVLNVTKTETASVSLSCPTGVTAKVLDRDQNETAISQDGTYKLVPNEIYTYIATKGLYYHTSAQFTAADALTVNVEQPITEDWLQALKAANGTSQSSLKNSPYEADKEFIPSVHEYTYSVSDCNSSFGVWATTDRTDASINGKYRQLSSGEDKSVSIISSRANGINLTGFVENGGFGNSAVVAVHKSPDENGVIFYQDYIINISRIVHIYDMDITDGKDSLLLYDNEGNTDFDRDLTDYYIEVAQETKSVSLAFSLPETLDDTDIYGGYTATVSKDGNSDTFAYTKANIEKTLTLDPSKSEETITISLSHESKAASLYTITVKKLAPVSITIHAEPLDATVYITDDATGIRQEKNSEGVYQLLGGHTYSYNVTDVGYIGKRGSIKADSSKTVSIALAKANKNTAIDGSITSAWPDFRGSRDNNAVVDAAVPIKSEDTVLYWANKIGEGYSAGAVGSPIIVDGYLYTYAGNKIFKVDTVSGDIVATGDMDHSSSFSITPPTYADGMVFVALSNGCVQAFNAKTLDSLWIYKDELKGQPNSPIAYYDGYVYTGFWNSETKNANYVCISATDENTSCRNEEKFATWEYTKKGGFYWAGAYVCDNFLIVGTDDGANGYTTGFGSILSFDPKTGSLHDSMTMPNAGDIRSTITYDSTSGAYYFTSKGGYFYTLQMNADGTIKENTLKSLALNNGTDDAQTPPMSTSTPVVHNGRAYIGVAGTGQFNAYSGHNITVIDLKKWSIAYKAPTQGYPQTSGLLSTYYDTGDGTVYIYFLDNFTPGKLRVISDRPGQTKLKDITEEKYSQSGKTHTVDSGYVLFTPSGGQSEYAICSPIADEYGTIYFKNDSAYMMAVGNTIKKIEVTEMPTTKKYYEGSIFDPTGMRVTAIYSNGQKRDVTKYVSYSKEKLTCNDTEITVTFDHVMYQNSNGKAGAAYTPPAAEVDIAVIPVGAAEAVKGEIAAIGNVTLDSKTAIDNARSAYEKLTADEKTLVTNYSVLTRAEASYALLLASELDKSAANDVVLKIADIAAVTKGRKEAVEAVRAAYNALSEAQKALVYNYNILVQAEAALILEQNVPKDDLSQYSGSGSSKATVEKRMTAKSKPLAAYKFCEKISKKSAKTAKLSVILNKMPNVSGYEIQLSANKKKGFKTVKALNKALYGNCMLYGLVSGRIYYYRTRWYRIFGDKKIYGSWSAIYKTTAVKPSEGTLTATWWKAKNAVQYQVQASDNKGKGYRMVANTKNNAWTGKGYIKLKRYYMRYRVCVALANGKKVYTKWSVPVGVIAE